MATWPPTDTPRRRTWYITFRHAHTPCNPRDCHIAPPHTKPNAHSTSTTHVKRRPPKRQRAHARNSHAECGQYTRARSTLLRSSRMPSCGHAYGRGRNRIICHYIELCYERREISLYYYDIIQTVNTSLCPDDRRLSPPLYKNVF